MVNLETAVESRKSAQALDAPGKAEKCLITNKVTTNFSTSPCTSITSTSFSRLTAASRLKRLLSLLLLLLLESGLAGAAGVEIEWNSLNSEWGRPLIYALSR